MDLCRRQDYLLDKWVAELFDIDGEYMDVFTNLCIILNTEVQNYPAIQLTTSQLVIMKLMIWRGHELSCR